LKEAKIDAWNMENGRRMGWMRGADGLIERPIHGEKTKAEK
jgi:hypothetical protein